MPELKLGGKREGAGRKSPAPGFARRAVPLRLPEWLVAWLDQQSEKRAQVIEAALVKAHRLTPPRKP